MKVIFIKNAPPYKVGQIINVADGYAQNYLFPNNLAQAATPKAIKTVEANKLAESTKEEDNHKATQSLIKVLAGAKIHIDAKAASSGTLYAAVSPRIIREAVAKQLQCSIPIEVENEMQSIKTKGMHAVSWKLDGQLITFTVDI